MAISTTIWVRETQLQEGDLNGIRETLLMVVSAEGSFGDCLNGRNQGVRLIALIRACVRRYLT